jgi:hypothetical protein
MIQAITAYSLDRDKKHHHESRAATPGKKKCKSFHQPKLLITDEEECSGTTATTASIKQVDFAPLVQVRSTIGLDSYTPEEIQASWYSAHEVEKIEYENNRTIQKLERGIPLQETKYCARGLEHRMRLARIVRSQNKRQARHCVMEEQRLQILDSNIDENMIASIYLRNTASLQLNANAMGMRDAREAEEYMDEDNNNSNRSYDVVDAKTEQEQYQ